MRLRFLTIFVLFAVAGLCFAKDKRPKPVQPVYVNSKPLRVKPIFEKSQFERGNRVRPTIQKPLIEKPHLTKKQMDKPLWDKDQLEKAKWDKTVLETKWRTDSQEVFVPSPTEKKSDSKVKRKWFRDLRAP